MTTSSAFSLVEMLIVIATIGILAAISIPALSGVSEKAGDSADRRNAQSLAAMAGNAISSGNLTILDATSREEVVGLLIEGVTGTGTFEGVVFKMTAIDPVDLADVLALLDWDGETLVYSPS